jgi:hypothetical protein
MALYPGSMAMIKNCPRRTVAPNYAFPNMISVHKLLNIDELRRHLHEAKRSHRNKSFIFTMVGDMNQKGEVTEINTICEVFEDFIVYQGGVYKTEMCFAFMYENQQSKLHWKLLLLLK